MHSDRPHFLAVIELQAAVSDRAKAVRLLQDRVKYWREISGRRIDDLQHLGGRSLSVQRFLLLGQQPRVLDGDDSLRGEGPKKRYLLIRKRINFGTSKHDCSDSHSLTQQWNASCRPVSKLSREGASFGKFVSLRLEVNYMNRLSIDHGTATNTSTRARVMITDLLRDRTPVGGCT